MMVVLFSWLREHARGLAGVVLSVALAATMLLGSDETVTLLGTVFALGLLGTVLLSPPPQ